MNPSTRAVDVLRVLRDLRPEQARVYLFEASSALDQAELAALERALPAGALNDSQTAPTELIDPVSLPAARREPVRLAPHASTLQIVRAALRPGRWLKAGLVLVGVAVGVGIGVFFRVQPFSTFEPSPRVVASPPPPTVTAHTAPVVVNARAPAPSRDGSVTARTVSRKVSVPVKRADRDAFSQEF